MGKLTKKLRRLWMVPFWIAWPLVLLGAWYLLAFPFGLDWFGYGISIAFAVAFAAWARPRYRVTVLERSDRGVVYWVRRVKKGEEKAQEQPPPATDSPSRLDQPFPSAEPSDAPGLLRPPDPTALSVGG